MSKFERVRQVQTVYGDLAANEMLAKTGWRLLAVLPNHDGPASFVMGKNQRRTGSDYR